MGMWGKVLKTVNGCFVVYLLGYFQNILPFPILINFHG